MTIKMKIVLNLVLVAMYALVAAVLFNTGDPIGFVCMCACCLLHVYMLCSWIAWQIEGYV